MQYTKLMKCLGLSYLFPTTTMLTMKIMIPVILSFSIASIIHNMPTILTSSEEEPEGIAAYYYKGKKREP